MLLLWTRCLSAVKILQEQNADKMAIMADPNLTEEEKRRNSDRAAQELYRKTGLAKIQGTTEHLRNLLEHGREEYLTSGFLF